MLNDPLAVKQRWYCKNCKSRYKTRFGVLIEFKGKGIAHYCYAELPPLHMYDAKGMMVERMHPGIQTPENLYEAVPSLKPAAENLLVPTQHEGHYKIVGNDELKGCVKLSWDHLDHLPKVKDHGSAKAAVAHSRANAGVPTDVSHPTEEPRLPMEC